MIILIFYGVKVCGNLYKMLMNLYWCSVILGSASKPVVVTSGVQSFRFSYILPKDIPSTFGFNNYSPGFNNETLHVSIHHLIKVSLIFPSGHDNIVHIEPIMIVPFDDLNDMPEVKVTIHELHFQSFMLSMIF